MNPYYIILTPFFPTATDFRGPFVYDQTQAIQKTGIYKVIVFKPKKWYSSEKEYEYQGTIVYRYRYFTLPSNILPGLFNRLTIWSFKRRLKSLGITIDQISVAHAHVTENGFLSIALKKQNAKIKTIVQHHGFDVLSLGNGIFRSLKWHRRWVESYGMNICNKIDLHVGVSNKTLDYLRQFTKIIMKDSYVLYNGVDSQKFYKKETLRDFNCFTIGCIGNFWPLKDQITLIKALELLIYEGCKNVKLVFIGSGVTLNKCELYVREHNLSQYISFESEKSHDALCDFYNTLDLFVLPSYHEAFGCVYTEAYACRVPFMAVKDQGIAELIPVEDHDRWLINKEDYMQLSKIIQNFITYRYAQDLSNSITIEDTVTKFLDTL